MKSQSKSQSEIDSLLARLETANKDPDQKSRNNESRKIRKRLRALGHRGGLRSR